jgi:hypothetical protein
MHVGEFGHGFPGLIALPLRSQSGGRADDASGLPNRFAANAVFVGQE